MKFKEAINWLYSFQKFGIKLGLERITHIVKELGNPHKKYTTIHVGGTNGKGSVCHFLESILDQSGYSVGIYTSPHLQNITERITINHKEITNDELIALVEKVKPIIDEMIKQNNNPTFFEVFTAIAFEYFKEKNVDFAILEVGLGGRFDATNIVNPEISIITNVSLEHQNILGEKIQDIAFEKAGIIKEKTPVITATRNKALRVLEKIADEKKSDIRIIRKKDWERTKWDNIQQKFKINSFYNDYIISTKLIGEHQGENIAISIGAIEYLQNKGFTITKNSIQQGIKKTLNNGRMEIINTNPFILLDGAHNIAGMKTLYNTLRNDFKYEKLILVLGILSDKNIKEMLQIIIPIADIVILTKSKNDRACSPNVLNKIIKSVGIGGKIIIKEEISEALEYSKQIAEKDDLICVTGSLFTVGETKEYIICNLQKC